MTMGIGAAGLVSLGTAAIGAMNSGDGGGGGQTQTVSKDPWSAADPWLRQQITTGQGLQGYYQNNPFNQQQQNAYGLLSQGNAYTNALVPSLLGQISGQAGFDRTNPRAKPAGISFDVGGNLGFGAGGRGGSGGGDQAAYDRAYQYLDAQHREKYGIPFAQSGDKAGMERELAKIRAEAGMSNGYGFGGDMNIVNNPFANGGIKPPAAAPAVAAPATNPAQDEMYRWWLQNTPNQYNSYGGGGGGGGGDGGF